MQEIVTNIKENKYLKISLILTLIIYLPSLYFNFFIFDDNHNIILNSRVTEISDLLLPWSKSKIPLSYNYWQIMNLIFGTDSPVPFRLINIFLHITNGLLIFKLLNFSKKEKVAAAIATSIFLLHPVLVQSVVWLSSSRELFATFFTLLAAHTIVKNEASSKSLVKGLVLFIISIFFKPISIASPIILLGYIYKRKREYFLPTVSIILIVLFSTLYMYFNEILKATALFEYNLLDSLGVSLISLSYYIRNFFAPFFLEYNYNLTPRNALEIYSSARIFINFLFIALPLITIFILKGRKKELLLSLFSFLLLILINTGLIPFNHQYISTVTDRYLYLPSIALIFFIYYFLSQTKKENHFKLSFIILTPLLLLSFQEVSSWRTSSSRLFKKEFSSDIETLSYVNALIKEGRLKKAQHVANTKFMKKSFIDDLNVELSIFQASYKNTTNNDFIENAHTNIKEVPQELYPLLANYSYHHNNFHLARLSYVYSQNSSFKYLLDFNMEKLQEKEKDYNDKIIKEVTLLPILQKNKQLSKKVYEILRPLVSDKKNYDLEVQKELNPNAKN